jgi:16S rRNA processing protein RimM
MVPGRATGTGAEGPRLSVGFVARAHGLKGEVAVRCFDPESTSLQDVKRCFLRTRSGEERAVTIAAARPVPREVLLVLREVQGRDAAEALVGASVEILREDVPPPTEGEFFQGDLIGLAAVDPGGGPLGRVEELFHEGFSRIIADECAAGCAPSSFGAALLALFDDDGDGAISLDELRASQLTRDILAPDVDLFAPSGAVAPACGAAAVAPDALSVAIGFSARRRGR